VATLLVSLPLTPPTFVLLFGCAAEVGLSSDADDEDEFEELFSPPDKAASSSLLSQLPLVLPLPLPLLQLLLLLLSFVRAVKSASVSVA
jgi:hypothetical protein